MSQQWGPQDLNQLRQAQTREVGCLHAQKGMVVEVVDGGWVGAIVGCEKAGGMHLVVLEDARGVCRSFPLGHGFLYEGQAVELLPPAPAATAPATATRTASGSRARRSSVAQQARASRIWVEGTHDAELVEKIWGEDLRELGIVVEPIGGIDHLPQLVAEFGPTRNAKLAVLVDHLVPGSKEDRIVEQLRRSSEFGEELLVLGHPYVDVWQAIKPAVVGLAAWPEIPYGQDWKRGILAALSLPHRTQSDVAQGWKQLLAKVKYFADLQPPFLASVEQLLDFLTSDDEDRYA